MSILILEPLDYSQKAVDLYASLGTVHFGIAACDPISVETIVVRLKYKIDENFCTRFPNLKFVVTPTTGLNHIDIDYLKRQNIRFISLRDTKEKIKHISSTTEIAVWHIINIVRKASCAVNGVAMKSEWQRDDFKSRQLSSLLIGIVGLGRIGLQTAKVCDALGMQVQFYDPYVKFASAYHSARPPVRVSHLKDLLSTSDLVSLHIPLNMDTDGMINAEMIDTMKATSYLVNTSRGELVDEGALCRAILQKKIAGYGCDVLSAEHDKSIQENEILKLSKTCDNIQVTPHIGGCTIDAMHLTEEIMANEAVNVANELSLGFLALPLPDVN